MKNHNPTCEVNTRGGFYGKSIRRRSTALLFEGGCKHKINRFSGFCKLKNQSLRGIFANCVNPEGEKNG